MLCVGSGYFTCIQNMILVTNKFKPEGLHEKHVVATWNLGNHLSICLFAEPTRPRTSVIRSNVLDSKAKTENLIVLK